MSISAVTGAALRRRVPLRPNVRPLRMPPSLTPDEPLHEVAFVLDYVQLVFQGQGFSLYNTVAFEDAGRRVVQGQSGFADALVSLIGQRARMRAEGDDHALVLEFEAGAKVLVLKGAEHATGPEAYRFSGPDDLIVVASNR